MRTRPTSWNSQATGVSVVLPVYRNWEGAEEVVADVAVDSASVSPLDIVVVDDASGDGRFAGFAARHPEVTVAVRDENGGFAAAVNTGIGRATGDVIVVVNSDLKITRPDLDRLIREAASKPYRIVGPRTVDPRGVLLPTARRFHGVGRLLAEFFIVLRLFPWLDRLLRDIDYPSLRSSAPTKVDWLVGSCLAFHRDIVDAVGPLDERFHMNSEEVDWQLRAREAGIDRVYLPHVIAVHEVGASSPKDDTRFLWIWESRHRYVEKHHGRAGTLVLRIGMVLCFLLAVPVWIVASTAPSRRHQVATQVRRHWRAIWVAG